VRTAQFLLVGGLLLAASVLLGRLFEAEFPQQARWVARTAFLAVWAALTLFNLWVGVSRAGYSLAEEVPVFLVLFGLPAVACLAWAWLRV